MTSSLGELTGSVWDFVRSDPGSVRRLNSPGNWSTWQATRHEAPKRDVVGGPVAPFTERRSLRRRRRLTA
jgi:hypothetical protein